MTCAELLANLIAFDTTSRNPTVEITDFLADYLAGAGCEVRRYAYDGGRKINLLAHKGPAAPGGLMLSGHVDVVPAADQVGWESDPFAMVERDARYYGRGTSDMKGFVSLAIEAIARADAAALRTPLCLLLTSDEEIGTWGAQRFVADWDDAFDLPSEAIVGEPTLLRVVRMHKGHLKIRFEVGGKSSHTGYPHLGVNAIEPAADLIAALRDIRKSLEMQRVPESGQFPETPYPVLSVSVVSGGSAVNITPDRCTIDVGVRLLPGQRTSDFLEQVDAALKSRIDLPHERVSWKVLNDSPPLLTPADAPICRGLLSFVGQADALAVSYASDAGPLQELGINSVIWGPGSIEVAHQPNEYIDIEQFDRGEKMLNEFIRRRCC